MSKPKAWKQNDENEPADTATALLSVPDVAQDILAFRTWEWDPQAKLLGSVSAHTTWTPRKAMQATCHGLSADPEHVPPVEGCSCGIYCGKTIDPVAPYIPPRRDLAPEDKGRVVGVIRIWGTVTEHGGGVIPGEIGDRAEFAKIGALLLVNGQFTVSEDQLEVARQVYDVPLLVPHSEVPEDYRVRLDAIRKGSADPFAADLDAELRELMGGDGNE